MKNNHVRGLRGDVGGWSAGATRRNTQFLYSVREDQLTGQGYAVTLTLRDCPPDSAVWHRLRRAWMKRMERVGMVRLHWVTEWQRRGVPHLHVAIWWPVEMMQRYGFSRLREKMVGDWLMLASEFRPGQRGQDAHEITGAVGWFQYVSKHAARGVKHYQRCIENVPPAWQLKTGRMWGKWGDWPVQVGVRVLVQGSEGDGGFYAFRRMVRSWRVADARASGELRRLQLARTMLRCPDRRTSSVRGYSEWIPQALQLAMFANLAERGFDIRYDDGSRKVADVDRDRERREDAEFLDAAFADAGGEA
jgi:hypothetical protein